MVNFKRSPQKLNLSTSPTKQTGTPRPAAALHAANQGWLSDLEGFQAGLVKLYAIYFMKKSTTEKPLSNTHAESKIKKKKAEDIICSEFALKEPRQHSFIFEKIYD